ncbi:hypothetical protein C7212DRAFT_319011 [Tuber magnatum]|uniref:Uncharacterized protein n=1 Tax=Tuber magnatum TaxID=42249 RepID=A0A317SU18_9PEZI|nr:hypothetical protein C7212DRAFT_319011 [Tuber magnatum]
MPSGRNAAAVPGARTGRLQSFTGRITKSVCFTRRAAAIKRGIPSKPDVKEEELSQGRYL